MHMWVTVCTQVVGIDPDTERLQVAKEKYPLPNVVYQDASAEEIPGSDYDVVFSNRVLHWCKQIDKAFEQVFKCLKKGGKFGYLIASNYNVAEYYCTPAELVTPECCQHMTETLLVPSSDDLHQLALKIRAGSRHSTSRTELVIGSTTMFKH